MGRVIAKWERSSFYLATKMPLWTCKSLADAQRIFEEQLQRLGVEYIDFYLLHSLHKARYEQAKELGIVDWLWEQKAAGRIRNFGFSCHDNAAGFEAILRDQPWDFCQLQYNYLDRDDQGRHAGRSARRRRRAAACPALGRQRCFLGAALGGRTPQRACGALRHECRGAAGRQSDHL